MTSPRPELLFVAGPQDGQRAVLMGDVTVAGRSPSADINLIEESASRRQMQFALTHEGWVVENLSSSHRIRVNQKRYKAKKRILLATGDVVGAGAETEMLFVDAGDDPEEALRAFREAQPAPQPAEQPAEPAEPARDEQLPVAAPAQDEPAAEKPAPQTQKPSAPPGPEQLADQARKAKFRKYAILFGAYAVVFVIGAVLLHKHLGERRPDEKSDLVVLKSKDIAAAVGKELSKSPNATTASIALAKARTLFSNRNLKVGDLYNCVKQYKLYLACKSSPGFDSNEDDLDFQQAKRELIKTVVEKYEQAYIFERQGAWRRSRAMYEELLRIVPERERGDPAYEEFVKNVIEHVTYVRGEARKKK